MPVARTLWNLRIKVRDGVEMAADVLLPAGEGPFPSVVLRTPYARSRYAGSSKNWILRLVDCDYAVVIVDIRGRNDSDGQWVPWRKDPQDAYDVIEWAATQSWCTGKIGMVGGSYEGLTQWWSVLERPPHLACIAPLCVGGARKAVSNFGTGVSIQYWLWWMNIVSGKTFQYPGGPSWEAGAMHIPLKTLDQRYGLSRSCWSKYAADEIDFSGEAGGLRPEDYAKIDIPVLVGVGWWDDQDTMVAWQALQRAKSVKDCRLLIGAWDHAGNLTPQSVLGGLDVSASVIDTMAYIEQFLALHLKGQRTAIADAPRCRVFLTGEHRWDSIDCWPHPRAVETPFYLTSRGDARSLRGDGRLVYSADLTHGSDTFTYDPNHPGRDMSNLARFAWSDPPLDVRYLQRRTDGLVYTSDPLEESVMVSGRYRLRVFISSNRPDTDLFVNLTDVHPDGRAISLALGIGMGGALRLRHRNGPDPELLKPGEIYDVTIEGSWLHHVFKPSHRLRIAINSGNFPAAARNAGSGKHWADDEVLYPQTNTIHHSTQFPSQLLLPVVPRELR